MNLPNNSLNPYLCMRAILIHIKKTGLDTIFNSISISGLGTGTGNLDHFNVAYQMKKAFDDVDLGKLKFAKNLKEAIEIHQKISCD